MSKLSKKTAVLAAVGVGMVASVPAFAALDLTAVGTATTAAVSDVEDVAELIIGAAIALFAISKIRQVIKA